MSASLNCDTDNDVPPLGGTRLLEQGAAADNGTLVRICVPRKRVEVILQGRDMTQKRFGAVLSLFFALVLPLFTYAQSGATGAISGSVADFQGTPVSGAEIEITPAGSNSAVRTVYSDAGGNFTAASLPVGAYDIVVKAAGFSTSKYSNVTVRLTETTRFNPSLVAAKNQSSAGATRAADESEKVMVVSAPPVVAVDTNSPTTGRSVDK